MTILDYKSELLGHRPCDEGAAALDACKSRKAVFELAASPLGCDYLLQSIQEGWGPTTDDFLASFLPYVNGAYTVKFETGGRVVRSQVWSRTSYVEIDDSVRWLIVLGCMGKVKIKPFQVVKIYVDANSVIDIDADPRSIVYVKNYGGHVTDMNKVCKFNK